MNSPREFFFEIKRRREHLLKIITHSTHADEDNLHHDDTE